MTLASDRPAPGSDVDRSGLDESARVALERDLRAVLRGDVSFDAASRAVYATDSSNYRQVPLGVVFPRDHDDVAAALRVCAEHDAPVLGRGAGTSLAGQGCNVAVVVDLSRHMTRILEIDADARIARVEGGVVLDDLRRAAEAHGLTFGPDPATHAWCTIGGMIGNNSCGTHALSAGKTVDNVERLRTVLYGGETLEVGCYTDDGYAKAVTGGGVAGRVLGGAREIARRYDAQVRKQYVDIPRRVSGYNLDELLPDNGFHVARALVGTESTCVVVTEATLRLVRSPSHRRLVVLGYPDILAAADAVPSLLPHPLLGLEGFDVVLTDQMRARDVNVEHLPLLPEGNGWLLAEVGHDDPAVADAHATALVDALPEGVTWRRYDDAMSQRRVWLIRESGLGATAIRADGQHNLEGWEDAAVAPERLGDYLRAMTQLWSEYGYSGAWYGHFGQGCVHTRNNFDLHTTEGLAAYRSFVERAADLVVSMGGSLSGEHGDGQSRSELLERMYGAELLTAFAQFKALFDPRGRMNPGKVVDPFPLDTNLRFGPAYERESPLRARHFSFLDDGGSMQHAAERCVGVGRCRRDDTGTMCPSYRATRDERHSTRGRAKLLVEMFQGGVTSRSWRNEEVREALDLCLSCKGCTVDCPTHVDMATYKAEFLSHYYARRLRPAAMYALGLIPWAARAGTRAPTLTNALIGSRGLGRLLRRTAGVTTERPAPRFAARSLRRRPAARALRGRPGATVVLWPDTFTDAFRPETGDRLISLLGALGETVALPDGWACCARPLYDMGMLALARRTLTRALDVLEPYLAAGVPVVVPEPSCLASFRDELPSLLPDDPRARQLASLARSPAEQLLAMPAFLARFGSQPRRGDRAVVHPHCHARAAGTTSADRDVLELLGYDTEVLDAGCCGLAGSFGFNASHEAVSRQIGNEQWLPRVRAAASGAALVMDGFSCVMQADHLAGPESASLVDLLHEALAAGGSQLDG
ncbi:MAG: FAD-binding and (Fe-S)-binding domain-containing protein [Actinomycetes bacterium]